MRTEDWVCDNMFKVMCIVFLLIVALAVGIVRISKQCEVHGKIARIEQLRADVAKTDVSNNEDVLGQVTAANQEIAECQMYNRLWWSAWAVPDAWDAVEPIEVGRGKGGEDEG